MTRQLTFDLPPRTIMGRDDFFVSATNAAALAAIDSWQTWPKGKMIVTGPAGSGKTHLAHVWATSSNAALLDAASLDQAEMTTVLRSNAVVVEDCHKIGGNSRAEQALFHLHNLLAEQKGHLLLTANAPPRDWGLLLPDLVSRMMGTSLTRLSAPDDALLSAVLIKLFADRQIAVAPTLIPYLLVRMDRSFSAARALVAALDDEALARGTAVTRALASSLLDRD